MFCIKYLFPIFLFLLINSCGDDKEREKILSVNITEDSSSPDSLYFKGYRMIFPETTPQSLLQNISKIVLCKNLLFISDNAQHQIFAFTFQGQFLFRLLPKGRGPGECIHLGTFTCLDDSLLLVYATAPEKFMIYRTNGVLLREYPCPDRFFSDISAISGDQWACINFPRLDEQHYISFLQCNKDQITETQKISLSQQKVSDIFPAGNFILRSRSTHFTQRYNNRIYQLTPQGYKERFHLDFGKYNFPEEFISSTLTPQQFTEEIVLKRKAIYAIVNVKETKHSVFFNTNKTGTFIINLRDSICSYQHEIVNHELQVAHTRMVATEDPQNKLLAFAESVLSLKNNIQYFPGNHYPEAFKEKIAGLPDDSNPLLFLYEAK